MRMARGGRWLWVAPLFGLVVSFLIAVVGQDETAMAAGILLGQIGALVLGLLWLLLDISGPDDVAAEGHGSSLPEEGVRDDDAEGLALVGMGPVGPPSPPGTIGTAGPPPAGPAPAPSFAEPQAAVGTVTRPVEAVTDGEGTDTGLSTQGEASSGSMREETGPDAAEPGVVTPRRLLWLVTGLIVVQVFLQQPGQLVHDTRLDLASSR